MKILFTPITSSSIAHTIRSFALAELFVARGDKVFFTSCESKKDFIKSQGYEVVKSYKSFNLNDPNDQSVNYLNSHKKELVGWLGAEIEAARKVRADVVINSPGFFGPHVYYATGIPVVALMNGQYHSNSKGLMGISLSDDSMSSEVLRSVLRPIFNKAFIKNYLSEILDAYKILGIPNKIKSREDLYAPMHILIPGDEDFEPLKCSDSNTKYIGPLFWNGFERMRTDLTEKKLSEFKGKDKMIFINFGGSVFDLEIYKRILSLLNKIQTKVVVAIGPNFNRDCFPEDCDNLIIRNFVPGLRLCKFADVVVNTGSQGAIMQSLMNGRPVVSFPVGIDQAFFANRLEEMGLGRNVNKTNILKFSKRESYQFTDNSVPERVLSSVKEILKDPHYHLRAQKYATVLKNRHPRPDKEAVELIYNIVESTKKCGK